MLGKVLEMGYIEQQQSLLFAVSVLDGAYLAYCMPQDDARSALQNFDTKASILYLVAMSTFWILVLATGTSQTLP